MARYVLFPILLALSILFNSCASGYRLIRPETRSIDDGADFLLDSTVRIAWEYDVLYKAGNKYYSRLEKEKGISLIGLSILNTGQDTFYFPGDVQIFAGDEKIYPIQPEGVKNLLNQVEDRSNPYEGEWSWDLLFVIPARLINFALRVSADVDLSRELDRSYLYSRPVGPGHHTTGLVAFYTGQWRPLKFVQQVFP